MKFPPLEQISRVLHHRRTLSASAVQPDKFLSRLNPWHPSRSFIAACHMGLHSLWCEDCWVAHLVSGHQSQLPVCAGMTQQPQGQSDGSPVGWVAPEQPTLLIQPFSSNSVLLQYSSTHPHGPCCLIRLLYTAGCQCLYLSMDPSPVAKLLQHCHCSCPSQNAQSAKILAEPTCSPCTI